MARTGWKRDEPSVRRVWPSPGAREKGTGKDSGWPYPEPTQVPLGEYPKAYRGNPVEGSRQIGPVTSGEGVPAALLKCGAAGRSDQGGPTV